jgi:AcrR family transcriptional regulator
MPKDTFFNLPEDKRVRIEQAAIEEFGNYHFDASSVNRIVENAGIAKGSFYQYFSDKKDLYKHIMSLIITKKLEYMSPLLQNPFGLDVFTLLHELYASGLSFALGNPALLEIGNKLLSDPSHELYVEILAENKEKSDQFFLHILQAAENRGEIRQGLDLPLVAYLLTTLNIAVSDYYTRRTEKRVYSREMMEDIEKFIDIVRLGIANNEGGKTVDQS